MDFKKMLIRIGAGLLALLILVFAVKIVIYTPTDGGAEASERDMDMLFTPYVGAAHLTYRVVDSLPLPDTDWVVQSVQIGANHSNSELVYPPHTLTVFYEPKEGATIEYMPFDAFEENAATLFELIGNLEGVTFSVRAVSSDGGELDADFYDYRWSMIRQGDVFFQTADMPDIARLHAGALTGPIVIIDDILHLDPVEVIFSTDDARIAELWPDMASSVYDIMPNGFYILHLDAQTQSFEITDETTFTFVDYALSLPDTEPDGDRRCTTDVHGFLAARGSAYGLTDTSRIGAPTLERIVYFVQVEGERAISVTEEFLFTQ